MKNESLLKLCKVLAVMFTGMIALIASMGLVNAAYDKLIPGIYTWFGILNLAIGGTGTYAVYRKLFRKG